MGRILVVSGRQEFCPPGGKRKVTQDRFFSRLLVDDRKGCGGYSQLRGNLRPLLQAADPGSGWKLEWHNDLIAWVQANAVKLCPCERSIHIVSSDHYSVRAQHKSVAHVGL